MYFSDLADLVDKVRAHMSDTSELRVIAKDTEDGVLYEIDALSMDGDDRIVVEFDGENPGTFD